MGRINRRVTVLIYAKLSTLPNLWDKTLLPEIDVNQCTPQYLYNICNAIRQIRPTKDADYILEPVFVIKYELLPHAVISSTNVEQLFGDTVKILAPVVDFLIRKVFTFFHSTPPRQHSKFIIFNQIFLLCEYLMYLRVSH